MAKYIDLLLVEKTDGSIALVTIEAHIADIGYMVEFNNGVLGRVVKKAWGGEKDGEVFELIAAMIPTYEAEAAYWQSWRKGAAGAVVSENP